VAAAAERDEADAQLAAARSEEAEATGALAEARAAVEALDDDGSG
jgi:hypothetical protein